MTRNELLSKKYHLLKEFGYDTKTANKLKNNSVETLSSYTYSDGIIRAKKTFIKKLISLQNKYDKAKAKARKKANEIKFEKLIKYKNKLGHTKYKTKEKVNKAHINYESNYTVILKYQTTETEDLDIWEYYTIGDSVPISFTTAKNRMLKYMRSSLEAKYKVEITKVKLHKAYSKF